MGARGNCVAVGNISFIFTNKLMTENFIIFKIIIIYTGSWFTVNYSLIWKVKELLVFFGLIS